MGGIMLPAENRREAEKMERQAGESELLLTCLRTPEGIVLLRCAADVPHVVLPDNVLGEPVTALGP